jgi:putative transposase
MDKKYPSDMSDKEWEIIKDEFPRRKKTGGPRRYEIREVVNAVFYTSRGGCSWPMLPNDFPPWKSVYGYFREWKESGLWQRIHEKLRQEVPEQAGRHQEPSAGIISVKPTEKGGPKAMMQAKK